MAKGQDPWGGYRAGFTVELRHQMLGDFGIDLNLGPAAQTVYLDFTC